MIPGALLRACKAGPHLSYSLLGCPIHTDIHSNIDEPQYPAERANARLLTTQSSLKQYFEQLSAVTVSLMIGEIVLAKCSVDIKQLFQISDSQEKSNSVKKIEGAYELVGVAGNVAGSLVPSTSSAKCPYEALVGLSIELEKLPSPFREDMKEQSQSETPAARQPKRQRYDSEESISKSPSHGEAKKIPGQNANPPSKRRKLTNEDEVPDGTTLETSKESSYKKDLWKDAEDDFQKWRQAQESVFWKQVRWYSKTDCNKK